MKVVSDIPGFERRIGDKVEKRAAPRYREMVAGVVRVKTGAYRASLVVTARRDIMHKTVLSVGSPLHYGRPLEYGANVGPRKGPHMVGDHRITEVTRADFSGMAAEVLREQ
jgi:hypothetical protein